MRGFFHITFVKRSFLGLSKIVILSDDRRVDKLKGALH
jgi:hypothetical protein